MENITTYNPPQSGGRLSSAKLRGITQIAEEFEGLPEDVNRFDLLKLVKRAGPAAGFSPRMIQLLEYYLLFTKDCDWLADARPIVYQSLSKTAMEFNVSERQIQRLEKELFSVGALTWNDSGNHRRYGVRDEQSGEIRFAYGVDLSPLAHLREVLVQRLEEKRNLDEAWMEAKRRISGYRGQIRSLIAEAAQIPSLERPTREAAHYYEGIAVSIRTYMSLTDLHSLLEEHKKLYAFILTAIEAAEPADTTASISQEYTSTDDSNVAHIYSTKNNQSDKSDTSSPQGRNASQGSVAASIEKNSEDISRGKVMKEDWIAELSQEMGRISWKQVLAACSERFKAHLPMTGRTLDWSDIVDAASDLLPTLGISKAAWWEACGILGRHGAALCVVIIDQKVQDPEHLVRNPGGYLRAMVGQAKKGQLNLHGSIFGLLKRMEGKFDA